MSNDNDFIDGIFDNLAPEDFVIETSAIGVCDLASLDAQFIGPEAFERFVNRQVEVVRISYSASEGMLNTVAILGTREMQYIFMPDLDEDLEGYMKRMRREAQNLNASWTFIARKCHVGTTAWTTMGEEADDAEVGDEDVFQRAAAAGKMKVGVLFYAQRREGGAVDHRQGYLQDMGDSVLGELHMGAAGQQTPIFNLLG